MVLNEYQFLINTVPFEGKVKIKENIPVSGIVLAECENDARVYACNEVIKLFKKTRMIEEVLISKIEKNGI